MLHDLKILEQFSDEVYYGIKTFEFRLNDRNYKVGDKIHFTVYEGGGYVEHPLNYKFYEITYILSQEDCAILPDNFVIFSFKPFIKDEPRPITYTNTPNWQWQNPQWDVQPLVTCSNNCENLN